VLHIGGTADGGGTGMQQVAVVLLMI